VEPSAVHPLTPVAQLVVESTPTPLVVIPDGLVKPPLVTSEVLEKISSMHLIAPPVVVTLEAWKVYALVTLGRGSLSAMDGSVSAPACAMPGNAKPLNANKIASSLASLARTFFGWRMPKASAARTTRFTRFSSQHFNELVPA
jgi:hypothetical protein